MRKYFGTVAAARRTGRPMRDVLNEKRDSPTETSRRARRSVNMPEHLGPVRCGDFEQAILVFYLGRSPVELTVTQKSFLDEWSTHLLLSTSCRCQEASHLVARYIDLWFRGDVLASHDRTSTVDGARMTDEDRNRMAMVIEAWLDRPQKRPVR
jgi:hypothetical protein